MGFNKRLFIKSDTGADCNYPTASNGLQLLELEQNTNNSCSGGVNGTWSGSSAYSTTAKFGSYSAEFSGGTGGTYINSGIDPDGSTSWTVSFWLYRTTDNFEYAFGSTDGGILNGIALGFYNSASNGKFDIIFRNASTTTYRSQGGTTSLNTWFHVAITHDSSGSGSTSYYKDGSLVSANTTYSNPFVGTQTSSQNWIFGSAGTYNVERLDGLIDRIRIYDTALTSSQVNDLANES